MRISSSTHIYVVHYLNNNIDPLLQMPVNEQNIIWAVSIQVDPTLNIKMTINLIFSFLGPYFDKMVEYDFQINELHGASEHPHSNQSYIQINVCIPKSALISSQKQSWTNVDIREANQMRTFKIKCNFSFLLFSLSTC